MPVIKYKDNNGVTHKLPVVAAMDDALSTESTNGVQNRIITEALNNVGDVDKYTNLIKLKQDNIVHITFGTSALEDKASAYSVVVECEPDTEYYIMKDLSVTFKVKAFDETPVAGATYDVVDDLHYSSGYRIVTSSTNHYLLIEFYNGSSETDALEIFKSIYICKQHPFVSFENNNFIHYNNVLYPTASASVERNGVTVKAMGESINISGLCTGNQYFVIYNGMKTYFSTATGAPAGEIEPGRYRVRLNFVPDYQNSDLASLSYQRGYVLIGNDSHTVKYVYDGSIIDVKEQSIFAVRVMKDQNYGDYGVFVQCSLELITNDKPDDIIVKQSGELAYESYRHQSVLSSCYYNDYLIVTSKVGMTDGTPDDLHSHLYGGVKVDVYNKDMCLVKTKLFTTDDFIANSHNPDGMRGELCALHIASGYNGIYMVFVGYSTYGDNQHDCVLGYMTMTLEAKNYIVNPFGDTHVVISSKPLLTPDELKLVLCGYDTNNAYIIHSEQQFSSSTFYDLTYNVVPLSDDADSQFSECTVGYNCNKLYCVARHNDEFGVSNGVSVFVSADIQCNHQLDDLVMIKDFSDRIEAPQLMTYSNDKQVIFVGSSRVNENGNPSIFTFKTTSTSLSLFEIGMSGGYDGRCDIVKKNAEEYYFIYSAGGARYVSSNDSALYDMEISQDNKSSYAIYSAVHIMSINMNSLLSGRHVNIIIKDDVEEISNSVTEINSQIDNILNDQLSALYELFSADLQKWLPIVYDGPKKHYSNDAYVPDSFQQYYDHKNSAQALQCLKIMTANNKLNQYVTCDNLVASWATTPGFGTNISVEQEYIVDDDSNSIATYHFAFDISASPTATKRFRLAVSSNDETIFLQNGHKYYFSPLQTETNYFMYRIMQGSQVIVTERNSFIFECTEDNYWACLAIIKNCPAKTYNISPSIVDLTAIFGVGNEPSDIENLTDIEDLIVTNYGRVENVEMFGKCNKINQYVMMNQYVANPKCEESIGYIDALYGSYAYDSDGVTLTANEDGHYDGLKFNNAKFDVEIGEKWLGLIEFESTSLSKFRFNLSATPTRNYVNLPVGSLGELTRRILTIQTAEQYLPRIVSNQRMRAGDTLTVRQFYVINLTKMFGAGREPLDVNDQRINEIVDYITLHPAQNKTGTYVSLPSSDTYEIPSEVMALDGYGECDSINNKFNTLDLVDKKFIAYGHYVADVWQDFDPPQVTDVSQYIPYDVMLNTSQSIALGCVDENDKTMYSKCSIDYLIKH